MEPEKSQAPIPVQVTGDVGVHLAYIRRDIDDIKKLHENSMKEIKSDLHDLKGAYVTTQQFSDSQRNMSREIEETKELVGGMIKKEEFDPVKRVVYGLVSIILVAAVGAILSLVIK